MKASEFTTAAPGQVLEVGGGCAFLPQPLPPPADFSLSLFRANDDARGAVGEFLGESLRLSNQILVTRPLLIREAIDSNALEGTYTQAEDVLLRDAGAGPKDPQRVDDLQEVDLYREALTLGESWISDGRPITVGLIRGLHAELLSRGRGSDKHPGAFRSGMALIGSRGDDFDSARFVPPPPEQVGPAMDSLVSFMAAPSQLPPLISAGLIHYQFETIHPFEDGNGRIGRLLIPLYLLAQGIISRPILYVSHYLESRRDEYTDHLKRVSTHGDWETWLQFFLAAVHSQAKLSAERVETLLKLEEQYRNVAREKTRSQAALAAVDVVMQKLAVTAPDVQRHVNCSYHTARTALETLAELGIVERAPDTYPQIWISRELMRAILT